jgi:ribonuclease HII
MLLLGVDEAGKGPVIGSMFVVGVVVVEEKLFDLAALGVKDSKQLAPAKRELLARKILGLAEDHYVLEVTTETIDQLRQVLTMNDIMVRAHSQVVSKLSADRAILDAADVDEQRFGERVRKASGTTMEVIAQHRADQNYLVVSAASILAKTKRDQSMRELEREIGCSIGSGYPADPNTLAFLEQWVAEKGDLPGFVRKSWATAQRIKTRGV